VASITTDLVILNADIRAMTSNDTRYEALAASDGRISALGAAHQIEGLAGPETVVLDIRGRTVLPGFIDAHTHLGLVAKSFATAVDCRSPRVRSIADILARVRARCDETPPGTWLLAQGTGFQDELLEDRRFPTPDELDAVSAEHPIVYRSTLHHVVANRKALELAGITRDTPDPPGGGLERRPDGTPTGVLFEMFDRFPIPKPTDEELRTALHRVAWDEYLAHGVTSIQEIWDSIQLMSILGGQVRSREVPLRVRGYGWVPLAGSLEEIASGAIGDAEQETDWFESGGIKVFADGGTSTHTAAFYDDYADRPGWKGTLGMTVEELAAVFVAAHETHSQVMVHAAGDLAQDTMLDAVEVAAHPGARTLRHRIEHGANTTWTAARSERCRQLGVTPVPNPGFIYNYGEFWLGALGPARGAHCVPLRTLIEEGFTVAGNSDTSGADPILLNPFHNMWCTMRRETFRGRVLDPDERISREDAMTMYTRSAAELGHMERTRGTLELDKLADVIVLSEPVDLVRDEDWEELQVLHTVVDGRLVYSADDPQAQDLIVSGDPAAATERLEN
jgi:predicted amidohydrolase YtcJ